MTASISLEPFTITIATPEPNEVELERFRKAAT
jgi:hypothetical protein